MDRARLEEFRRKLREGRPVRVVDGEVKLAGAGARAGQSAGGDRKQRPEREPQGVRVKPHEWGAASASLHATEAGQRRALAERDLLAREYPGFVMDVDDDGTVFAHGWIGPTENLKGSYHVLLVMPPGYGQGVMPVVHVLEPPLRADAPHRFRDGSLCLDHSGAFTRRSTLVTILAWVSVWLVLYEGWIQSGRSW
ncbi:MAG: hypothetical protein ACQEXJ_20960 [Myxococcota bacterium]